MPWVFIVFMFKCFGKRQRSDGQIKTNIVSRLQRSPNFMFVMERDKNNAFVAPKRASCWHVFYKQMNCATRTGEIIWGFVHVRGRCF